MAYIDRGGHFQYAGRLTLRGLKGCLANVHLTNSVRAMMKVFRTRISHAKFSSGALYELHPQPLFQCGDLGADGGLGHVEQSRGTREAASLHDLHKYGDRIQIHAYYPKYCTVIPNCTI